MLPCDGMRLGRGLRVGAVGAVVAFATASAILAVPAGDAAFPGRNGALAFGDGGSLVLASPTLPPRRRTYRKNYPYIAWSPNGAQIAAVATANNTPHILVYSPYARPPKSRVLVTVRRSASKSPFPFADPTWSPDGRQIAFGWNTFRAPDPFAIRVIRSNGTGLRTIPRLPLGYVRPDPAWSPNGRRVAFVGQQRPDASCRVGSIFTASLNGTAITQVTRPQPVEGSCPDADVSPTWSPDGRRIAFVRERSLSSEGGGSEIWVVRTDGSGASAITTTQDDGGWVSPAWSPDGRKIAAARGGQIWVMNADGSGKRRVTAMDGVSLDWQRCVARGPCGVPR